jgi:hypothetical protein
VNEADLRLEYERYMRDENMASKLGGSFGQRVLPKIRFRKGRIGWWHLVRGPHRTRRAAFRWARKIRDGQVLNDRARRLKGSTLVVLRLEPKPGNKCPEFWIAKRRKKNNVTTTP